jgi:hypothetical protein
MRRSNWTTSIVAPGDDQTVYIVLDDFGRNGRAYRETDVDRADLEAVILDMLEGQYQKPVRVVGFNTAEKWSQDVSGDVAHELRWRCDLQLRDVPFYVEERRGFTGPAHAADPKDPALTPGRSLTAASGSAIVAGRAHSKQAATVAAEKAIDRALAIKKVRLVPPERSD